MGIRSRNRQQPVASIHSDHEITESTQAGEVVNLAQQTTENFHIIIRNANESGIGTAKFFSRARQGASPQPTRAGIPKWSHSLKPAGIVANNRLLIRRLVPQTHYSNNFFPAARNSQVLYPQTKCGH